MAVLLDGIGHTARAVIAATLKSGLLCGDLPFVRLGAAPRKLVIFPGLADAAWDVVANASDALLHYGNFAREFTVYLISRKRGLPVGYTTRQMAADYARAIEDGIGPASILGISLGGHIAQHFAADFPRLVQKLVIASAAHRVSEEGGKIPRRWLALAQENRWREFYFDIGKATIEEYHHTFYQFLLPLLRRKPPSPNDFMVSLEASLGHDGTESLNRIQAPTLVIGGTKDRFFPESLLRETARWIPNATLRLLDGTGHGACEERRSAFEQAVIEFLKR